MSSAPEPGSPFPGMDPYLEDPALWPDFHRPLVATLFQILLPGLVDRYRVVAGRRGYTTVAGRTAEDHQEDYLEIRQRADGSLVTLVDVVSPANKTTDVGRKAYLERRRSAKDAGANVVEIDLVLQGRPTLEYSRDGLPDWDYAVTVTRSTQPERYEIYTATLQKRLPRFRLPLAADDRDTVLDLQAAFLRCYLEGGYSERIDYGRDPPGPLDEGDRRWLSATLRDKGLREWSPSDEEIARAAYSLWEKEGRPHGRDQEHWRLAAEQLKRQAEGG
jgi:hypothetical protein